MKRFCLLAAATLALAPLLATAGVESEWSTRVLPSPAGPGSGEPFLAASADGVYLSWLEKQENRHHALQVSRWDGSSWTAPSTVATSSSFFVNWADFPSVLALPGGRLAAHWLAKAGEGTFAYHVWIATSADRGRTWSTPVRPHTDRSETEHGFVTLLGDDDGFSAVWLDGRKFQEGDTNHPEMSLISGSHRDGRFGPETVLDGRVCDCCQTAGAVVPGGLFIAYRDRGNDELRDISYVRRVDGKWTEPRTLHRDGWTIAACPVNGPAVAAHGEQVAVAWFTSPRDKEEPRSKPIPQVQILFSDDSGASFGAAVRIDEGKPLGRVDVEWIDAKHVLVLWLEKTGTGKARIQARQVSADGQTGEAWTVTPTDPARGSGFPRMVRWNDRILVAWTETGTTPTVRLASLLRPAGTKRPQ